MRGQLRRLLCWRLVCCGCCGHTGAILARLVRSNACARREASFAWVFAGTLGGIEDIGVSVGSDC